MGVLHAPFSAGSFPKICKDPGLSEGVSQELGWRDGGGHSLACHGISRGQAHHTGAAMAPVVRASTVAGAGSGAADGSLSWLPTSSCVVLGKWLDSSGHSFCLL